MEDMLEMTVPTINYYL